MKKERLNFENGQEVDGSLGWCDLCNYSFGGSAAPRKSKHLNGKFYHLECYPAAVQIHLADLKLREVNC
jgi:hypothetical protein